MEQQRLGARGAVVAGVPAKQTPRRARAIALFIVLILVIASVAVTGIGHLEAYVGTPRHDDDASSSTGEMDRTPIAEPYLEDGTVIQLKERKMGSPAPEEEEEAKGAEKPEPEEEEEEPRDREEKEDVGGEVKANGEATEENTEDTTTTSEERKGASASPSPLSFAGLSDEDKVRMAPFAGDAGVRLDRWGIGGPAKGGVANETGDSGYAPYVHRPQTRLAKKGQWVTLERMLRDSGETAARAKKGGGGVPFSSSFIHQSRGVLQTQWLLRRVCQSWCSLGRASCQSRGRQV